MNENFAAVLIVNDLDEVSNFANLVNFGWVLCIYEFKFLEPWYLELFTVLPARVLVLL